MADSKWPFSKPLEFLHKVKYGGAVGKKTVITVVLLIVFAIGIVTVGALRGSVWAIVLIVLLAAGAFFWALSSIDKTLTAHPELALLDGSEFVTLRKAEMAAAKNMKVVDVTPSIPDPIRPTRKITASTNPILRRIDAESYGSQSRMGDSFFFRFAALRHYYTS